MSETIVINIKFWDNCKKKKKKNRPIFLLRSHWISSVCNQAISELCTLFYCPLFVWLVLYPPQQQQPLRLWYKVEYTLEINIRLRAALLHLLCAAFAAVPLINSRGHYWKNNARDDDTDGNFIHKRQILQFCTSWTYSVTQINIWSALLFLLLYQLSIPERQVSRKWRDNTKARCGRDSLL